MIQRVFKSIVSWNKQVMTIFLGQVPTRMWQDYDYNYYEKNKNQVLSPQKVAKDC